MPLDIEAIYRAERPRLKRLAYRYLGSVAEAEDVVQEAFLKLSGHPEPVNAAAWLARVVTNAALDRLRRQKTRRETYVGPFLPEPATGPDFDPCDEEIDISFAVMRTLEALSPAERAALFMHDLFDLPFEEIATLLRRTPQACRQLASRARKAVRSGRKRRSASAPELQRLVDAVAAAADAGPQPLIDMLRADAELISDGGGKAAAPLNVLAGAGPVARFLLGVLRKNAARSFGVGFGEVNGGAALVVSLDGALDSVIAADVDADGRAAAIYIQRNPEKLRSLAF